MTKHILERCKAKCRITPDNGGLLTVTVSARPRFSLNAHVSRVHVCSVAGADITIQGHQVFHLLLKARTWLCVDADKVNKLPDNLVFIEEQIDTRHL